MLLPRPRHGVGQIDAAEDACNTRDPHRVALAYTPDSVRRNRDVLLTGREEIVEFADDGLMRRREAGIDLPISGSGRRWSGPRPDDERGPGHDVPLA